MSKKEYASPQALLLPVADLIRTSGILGFDELGEDRVVNWKTDDTSL